MMRPMLAAAALALSAAFATALPAAAQDFGGVRPRGAGSGPGAVLRGLDQVERSGCRLSQTSVTFGVNRAFGADSTARQALGTQAGGCRPLVSTQVAAGVNLALGPRSTAEQSIAAQGPRGLLATTTLGRGVNIAANRGSRAGQQIITQSGR